MSDLERARAHLLSCQHNLAWARAGGAAELGNPDLIKSAELNVLAALSWAWEEQERAGAVDAFLVVGDSNFVVKDRIRGERPRQVIVDDFVHDGQARAA